MNIEILWTPNGGRLVVMLKDRALIRCEQATDTFVEAIKRIGIIKVSGLEIEVGDHLLISTTKFEGSPTQRPFGKYYITMGMSPEDMASKLKQIARELDDVLLYVELFPKQ